MSERQRLPSGVVTFVFSDIEGSTRLIRAQSERYPALLTRHRELLRRACRRGVEFGTAGDALFYAFEQPAVALDAAAEAQRLLAAEAWPAGVDLRVRMGVSAGSAERSGDDYVGLEVHRVARICAAAHGGQIVVSQAAAELAGAGYEFFDLGEYQLAGIDTPQRLHQLVFAGGETEFPELRATHDAAVQAGPEAPIAPAQAAQAVRDVLARVPAELREPLADLAARLFAGARAAEYADALVARIDRAKLEQRVATQFEMALHSPYAARESERLQTQVDAVAAVVRHRELVMGRAGEALRLAAVPAAISEAQVARAQRRTSEAVDGLDAAVTHVTGVVDPLAYKLRRTRYRGVYREGGDYLVPYVNHLGADVIASFDSAREAKKFRDVIRLIEDAKREIGPPGDSWARLD